MTVPGGVCAPESIGPGPSETASAGAGVRSENRSPLTRIRAFFGSGSEGGALVELAVTLPLVLLLITGIFAFSIALYQKLLLAEAVSDGGRVLAVARGQSDPCQQAAGDVYNGITPMMSTSNLTLTITLNGSPTVVSGGSTGAACAGVTMSPGGSAMITATYTCSLAVYGYTFPGCTLGSQVAEIIQ